MENKSRFDKSRWLPFFKGDPGALDDIQAMSLNKEERPTFTKAVDGAYGVEYRGVFIQSLPTPNVEALTFIFTQDFTNSGLLVVMGIGGGLLVRELLNALSCPVWVYEPSSAILIEALEREVMPTDTDPDRFQIFSSLDVLRFNVGRTYDKRSGELKLTITPAYKSLFPDKAEELLAVLKEGLELAVIHEQTFALKTREWVRGLVGGIRRWYPHPSVNQIDNWFEGLPVVIAAAGPSLDKNVEHLKTLKGRALIICVNTSFRALVKAGVVPDFVVCVESINIMSHFEGIEEIKEVTLLLERSCYRGLFELPAKEIITFQSPHLTLPLWAEKLSGEAAPVLDTGYCNAHCAFSVAVKLGCDPIVLIGQDLAYTEGRGYASGTVFEDLRVSERDDETISFTPSRGKQEIFRRAREEGGAIPDRLNKAVHVRVTSWDQKGQVSTTPDLNLLRYWYEERCNEAGGFSKKRINATEGGARIAGFESITLASVSSNWSKTVRERFNQIDFLKRNYLDLAYPIEEELKNYERLLSGYLELIALNRVVVSLHGKRKSRNKARKKLRAYDNLEQRMREELKLCMLLEPYIKSEVLALREEQIANPKPTDEGAAFRQSMSHARALYTLFADSIVELIDLFRAL